MTETCQRCGNRPGDRTLTLEAPRLEAGGKTPNPARLLLPVCGACFEQLARRQMEDALRRGLAPSGSRP